MKTGGYYKVEIEKNLYVVSLNTAMYTDGILPPYKINATLHGSESVKKG